jgi:hypothetical protein
MKDSPAASMMPAAMVAGQLVDEHTVATASAQGQESRAERAMALL